MPARCLACGALAPGRELDLSLCPACRTALGSPASPPPAPPGIDSLLSAVAYEGPALGLVAALKRGGMPAAGATAAELIAERHGPLGGGWVLVPVGRSILRTVLRGSDPAEEIALALGRRTSLPVLKCLRRRGSRHQRGRPRELRLADPPRFEVRGNPPPRALLVDDVVTTGGTLGSCAEALRAGGAEAVSAMCLAHTPVRGGGGP